MDSRYVLTLIALTAVLAACDSGDITLSPTTIDNSTSTDNSTTTTGTAAPPPNPCASYVEAGQTFEGEVDSNGDCVYDSLFVSDTRPITVSAITFPALETAPGTCSRTACTSVRTSMPTPPPPASASPRRVREPA